MRLSRSTARKRCSISATCSGGGRVLVRTASVRVDGRDAAGLAVERGREEQRLAVARALRDDPVDGRAEAHVEHPVGLVEDEDLDVGERDRAAREQVLEAAGRGHDEVGGAGVLDLLVEADAAVDGGDVQAAGGGQRARLLDDLARRAHASGRARARRACAPSGSSTSTIGAAKAIVLPEPVGDLARTSTPSRTSSMTSDWMAKGDGDAALGERAHDRLRQAELGEGLLRQSDTPWRRWGAAANDSGGCWLNPNRPGGGTQERTNLTGSRMPPVRVKLAATQLRA